jgi:hypothetical protein
MTLIPLLSRNEREIGWISFCHWLGRKRDQACIRKITFIYCQSVLQKDYELPHVSMTTNHGE